MKTPQINILPNGLTFARRCDECKQGMNDGYCISSGAEYYCSEKCLLKHYTALEWLQLYETDQDSYYTTWEDKADHQYKVINGVLVELE